MKDLSFRKLQIDDRKSVEEFLHSFPPYSDHHFSSLWSYNIDEDIEIAELNGNLVLKTFTYDSGRKTILTFIGINNIKDTINTLLTYAKKNNIDPTLHFIPEMSVKEIYHELLNEGFVLEEDRDNFDYIINVEKMVLLKGNKFFKHKRLIRKFIQEHGPYEIKELNLKDPVIVKEMHEIFMQWAKLRKKEEHQYIVEKTALNRALKHSSEFNFVTTGLYFNNKMIGYVINEPLKSGYYVGHFIKVDPSYVGVYQILEHESAKIMQKHGCKYLNNEQDLGDLNLRFSKSLWYPDFFLKKYKIYKPD